MSKKMLSMACALVISSVIPTGLIAADSSTYSNNYSTTLALIRSKNIDKMLDRVNQLKDYTKLYMYQTGDINPTATKVAAYFNLPDVALVNFTNSKIKERVDNNKYRYYFSNLFNSKPNKDLQQLLKNSTKLDPLATLLNGGTDIEIPYSPTTINFVKQVKELPNNAVISPIIPNDTSKIWYQPTGDGHFNVLQYNSEQKKWVNEGGFKHEGIVVHNTNDLKKFNSIANVGTKAYVKNKNGSMDIYVYDGDDWTKTTGTVAGEKIVSGKGKLFNGIATISDLTLRIFDKAGGSIGSCNAPHGEWSGKKNFTKKDNSETKAGGFWISDDKKFAIVHSLKSLLLLNPNFSKGTYVWIPNTENSEPIKLYKTYVRGMGDVWVYQANNLKDALKFLKQPRTNNSVVGELIYVKDKNVYLKRSSNDKILEPYTGNYFVSSKGRRLFNNLRNGYVYLTLNNDCNRYTCNGDSGRYGDKKMDGLYRFYTLHKGKSLNGLGDVVFCHANPGDKVLDDKCFKYPEFRLNNNNIWDVNSYIHHHTKYCYDVDNQWRREGDSFTYFAYHNYYNSGCYAERIAHRHRHHDHLFRHRRAYYTYTWSYVTRDCPTHINLQIGNHAWSNIWYFNIYQRITSRCSTTGQKTWWK